MKHGQLYHVPQLALPHTYKPQGQANMAGSYAPSSPIISLMCGESVTLEDSDQESGLIPEADPPIHSGPSTPQEGMYYYSEQVLSAPGGGTSDAVMLAPTRPPSFSNMTPGGNSNLYYSPPPAPLPYSSPEMLPPVVSLSPSSAGIDGNSQHPDWLSADSLPILDLLPKCL